jgi:glucosamine-phosphate N-acetyltransferase
MRLHGLQQETENGSVRTKSPDGAAHPLSHTPEHPLDIVIRGLTGHDLTERFLETLACLSHVELSAKEAARIFQSRLRAGIRTFIALHHGKIVGTVSLIIEPKFIHKGGLAGHIEDVAVHRDYQRRGIGTLLVRHATEQARKVGCYKVLLNCAEDKAPFYSRLGFKSKDKAMRLSFAERNGH